jgi:hypothetical protein
MFNSKCQVGGELSDKIELGFLTRTFLGILTGISMSLNKYLKVGFGEEYQQNGQYENPHLVFPLFRIMDRLVITRPGEIPPRLGSELPESDQDRYKRQNGLAEIRFGLYIQFLISYIFCGSFNVDPL